MTDVDELEWEEWNPAQLPFVHHMIAGSIAGLAEHISLFPIDTVKTHIQCERCGSASPMQTWNCAARIVHREGIFRLYRGVSAMFAACIPAHAAYFSVFESTKKILGADQPGHHPIQAAISGALATLSHDLFMTPFDMAKQRLQLGYYRSVMHCLSSVAKTEGMASLYIGLPTALIMNIPYGCILVPVNEYVRKSLSPDGSYSFSASMIAGCVAGAVAAAATNPLDVIKTRLQTQNLEPCPNAGVVLNPVFTMNATTVRGSTTADGLSRTDASSVTKVCRRNISNVSSGSTGAAAARSLESNPIKGIAHVGKQIFMESGYAGFFRGVLPRVLTQSPAVAISWTAYESMKKFLASMT